MENFFLPASVPFCLRSVTVKLAIDLVVRRTRARFSARVFRGLRRVLCTPSSQPRIRAGHSRQFA